jgi:hypothetical protein
MSRKVAIFLLITVCFYSQLSFCQGLNNSKQETITGFLQPEYTPFPKYVIIRLKEYSKDIYYVTKEIFTKYQLDKNWFKKVTLNYVIEENHDFQRNLGNQPSGYNYPVKVVKSFKWH